MKILAVDSSGSVATIGIAENQTLIYEQYANIGLTHSKTLVPMIDAALKFCGMQPADIDLYAVSAGPGSFTGIRIGISAAKAMAWAFSKPCVGVSSLEALAWNNLGYRGTICCLSDFVGGQLYNGFFQSDGTQITRLCDDRAISTDELFIELKNSGKNYLLVGNAADMCYNLLTDAGVTNVWLAPPNLALQHAYGVATVGYKSFLDGKHTSAADLRPCYIRIPQAEQERLKKLEGVK